MPLAKLAVFRNFPVSLRRVMRLAEWRLKIPSRVSVYRKFDIGFSDPERPNKSTKPAHNHTPALAGYNNINSNCQQPRKLAIGKIFGEKKKLRVLRELSQNIVIFGPDHDSFLQSTVAVIIVSPCWVTTVYPATATAKRQNQQQQQPTAIRCIRMWVWGRTASRVPSELPPPGLSQNSQFSSFSPCLYIISGSPWLSSGPFLGPASLLSLCASNYPFYWLRGILLFARTTLFRYTGSFTVTVWI